MAQWLNWGKGTSGSPNAISGTINTYATCTGTATELSLTTALSASAGDVILIHQSQGTGAGQWEINYVLADAGATLILAYPLAYTYGTGAQCVLVPQYTGGDISGAVTGTAWNGSYGGIIALMSNGDLTVSGSIKIEGIQGTKGSNSATTGGGFRGGASVESNNTTAYSGESSTSASSQTNSANGMAGGGGKTNGEGRGHGGAGGGGGYATAGGTGGASHGGNGYHTGGVAGGTGGIESLTSLFLGAGAGGAALESLNSGASGSSGGGIILIISKNITITGSISVNGGAGNSTGDIGGSGGSGGSLLIKCQIAILGSNLVTSSGGAAGIGGVNPENCNGGAGGVGRIRCDYFTSVSGSTTPTLSSAQDLTLNVAGGSGFFAFF